MQKDFDCVDGNMDILMYNNSTKKIKDAKVGDAVYAVKFDGYEYNLVKSEIIRINKRRGKAVKITLNDGRVLISSQNHQWLSKLGWHFSYDDGSLDGLKFYLKEDMKLFGMPNVINKKYKETPLYMAGYIIATEIYGRNLIDFRCGETADFVLRDQRVTMRVYNYMLYFGLDAEIGNYFAHTKDTNEYYVTYKLSVPYKELITFSKKYQKDKDKEEFIRGFVAGTYDSDGTENPFIKSVNSPKRAFLALMQKGLDSYNFEYEYNSQEMTAKLKGGPFELIRFYNIYNPVNICRFENIKLENKSSENIKIVSIEEVKNAELVEVITTARNFIANGIVSHNCTTGFVKED